jgi:hypothetical protein
MDKGAIGMAFSAAGVTPAGGSGVRFGLQHLATPVKAGGADVMTQVGFAGGRPIAMPGLGSALCAR